MQSNFNNSTGFYIGMMSGTSLDALDAVICQFAPTFKLIATHSLDFPTALKNDLLELCQPSEQLKNGLSEIEQYAKASIDYAQLCIQCVQELLTKASIKPKDVVAIGCHGQTVRHRPELHFTMQLLDANLLAEKTGISVISDFRMRDMAVGGQGAPLVPAFHQAMFSHQDKHRVLLNLGGIANISVLPASKSAYANQVTGFDTGPANLLMDAWCFKHTGKPYDENGSWASTGKVHQALLTQLLTHEFFSKPAPKSSGREAFHLDWLLAELNLFEQLAPVDVQATLVELTCISASDAIKEITLQIGLHNETDNITPANGSEKTGDIFVCGGGAYNQYVLSRLMHHLPSWNIFTTEQINLAPTWVEGVAFAWLARQHELRLTGNLPSVTGASKAVVLGVKCFA